MDNELIVGAMSHLRLDSFTCDKNYSVSSEIKNKKKTQTISLLSLLSKPLCRSLRQENSKQRIWKLFNSPYRRSEMISQQEDPDGNLQHLYPEKFVPLQLFGTLWTTPLCIPMRELSFLFLVCVVSAKFWSKNFMWSVPLTLTAVLKFWCVLLLPTVICLWGKRG